jgi:enediyne biosynthesis protein E4
MRWLILFFFLLIIVSAGCRKEPAAGSTQRSPAPTPSPSPSPTSNEPFKPVPIEFVDVTQASGISFKHYNGATGRNYLPERFGSGCAFLDYDNDGWQDILLVNSMDFAKSPRKAQPTPALYHNNHDGTFTDVTAATGLAKSFYGIGVATADYDNDGWTDILFTALGHCYLYRNVDGTRFEDSSTNMKLNAPMPFPAGATWFDFDKDGKLDLLISNYVDWSIEKEAACGGENPKLTCTAANFSGRATRLYRNLGSLFEDVTVISRLDTPGKSLASVVVDYDRDGWPDILVINDGEPNRLYHNNGHGQFTETAEAAQIAFSHEGRVRAGRGGDAADFDRSGYPSFVVAHALELPGIYRSQGKVGGLFIDEASSLAPSLSSRTGVQGAWYSGLFLDYDLDGWLDILISGGTSPGARSATGLQLLRNSGRKSFEDASRTLGPALKQVRDSRGVAYADYDRDGDLDLLISTNNGPAILLRNEHGSQNHFLQFRTLGTTSNRDGIGTKVVVFLPDGSRLWNYVHSSSGYCSQSTRVLTFGLGRIDKAARVEIEWPSGKTDRLENLAADQFYTIKEGSGIMR